MRWSTGHPARGAGRPARSAEGRDRPRLRGADAAGRRVPAPPTYALLWENSFSTGTPTLCRAREAQSRWKNSST